MNKWECSVLNVNFYKKCSYLLDNLHYEPVFNLFVLKDCDFKDVLINNNGFAAKVISKKIILNRNHLKNLNINKLYGKQALIDKNDIKNIVFTNSIINQEFMFVNESFNTINIMGTYFTGKVLFDLGFIEDTNMYKTFKYNISDVELIANLEAFLRIATNESNPDIKLRLKYLKDVQKNKVYNKGVSRFLNNILDITTGYFTNYKRIVMTMIVMILLFAFIYTLFPSNILIDGQPLDLLVENDLVLIIYNSIYFSLITFSTIVYGNIYPVGILKLLAGIEGLLGVITTASLITVFARKFS